MMKLADPVYTRTMAQMKEIDRTAIEDYGIDSLWLMENAASAVTELAAEKLKPGAGILIFCGSGNNGGDGVAAARQLKERGFSVKCFLCGKREKMTRDTAANEERLKACGGELLNYDPEDRETAEMIRSCDCIIDALFGVGLKRPLEGIYADLAERIGNSRALVIACDLPSGLNGDTGEVMGTAVRADYTVTFSCLKPGLLGGTAQSYAGQIFTADIGIPEKVLKVEDILKKESLYL